MFLPSHLTLELCLRTGNRYVHEMWEKYVAFLRDLAYDYPSQPGKLFAILLKGFLGLVSAY